MSALIALAQEIAPGRMRQTRRWHPAPQRRGRAADLVREGR